MIYLAIIINRLGHFIPAWINGVKFKELRSQLKWRQVFYELSGLITSFLLAFFIITIITLSSIDRYILNENAIYGVNCNSTAKKMGFKDGDKILTINNKTTEKFSDISTNIMLESNAKVKVLRNQQEILIEVDDKFIIDIINQKDFEPLFTPRFEPIDSTITDIKPLVITESRKGIKDVFELFNTLINHINLLFNPLIESNNFGAITIIIKDFKSFMMSLAMNLILVSIFCLLPIPGFDVGNSIIALIEKIRNKNFNLRRLRIVRITCVTLILLIYLSLLLI